MSKITDKLLSVIREWHDRELEEVYAHIILDATHYNVREDGSVRKKDAYIIIGLNLEGRKDILGIWLGTAESSKHWLGY